MIKLTIDGKGITARPDQTIFEVAKENGVYIPTLCYHAKLSLIKSCRICLVDVEGADMWWMGWWSIPAPTVWRG